MAEERDLTNGRRKRSDQCLIIEYSLQKDKRTCNLVPGKIQIGAKNSNTIISTTKIAWWSCDLNVLIMWLLSLWQVVGIELLGYRKRLQYGIGQLRRAHPDWAKQNVPNQQTSSATSLVVPKLPVKKKRARSTPTNPGAYKSVVPSSGPGAGVGGAGNNSRTRRRSSDLWRHPDSALTDGCHYHIKVQLK